MIMKNLRTTTILCLLSTISAFDNRNGWKVDENGAIVMKDGNPVYIDTNGAEKTVAATKIAELNAESKQHRERAEKAENELKKFEGITDPALAVKALETIKNLDAKKLIDAGDAEKVKAEAVTEVKTQMQKLIDDLTKDKGELTNKLQNKDINDVFKDSEFVREHIAMPREFFEASFKNNFRINKDTGKVEAVDKKGNPVYSKENPGEYATPEEALKILVEQHPQKDTILKANSNSGTNNQGNGGGLGKGRTMKRAEFDKLNPVQKAESSQKMAKGELTITD